MQLSPINEKERLREQLLKRRASWTLNDADQASHTLCNKLLSFINDTKPDTVLLFYPIRREPDLLPLAKSLIDLKQKIAFPISHKSTRALEFKIIASIDALTVGAYSIPEPPDDAPTLTSTENSVCLVPALGFDRLGMRIGYGAGYYDRFLKNFSGISVGVAFSSFIFDELPTEATDIPVDVIITEGEVIIINEKAKKRKTTLY